MRVIAGKNYTVLSQTVSSSFSSAEVENFIKDGRTYRRMTGDGDIEFDKNQIYAACTYDKTNGKPINFITEDDTLTFGNPMIVCVRGGSVYEFPDIPNTSFTDHKFANDVVYYNNISGMGEFIGASISRKGQQLSIQPLSFPVDASRQNELLEMIDIIRLDTFFVEYETPAGTQIAYGWLEDEPQIEWAGDFEYMTLTLNMRVYA